MRKILLLVFCQFVLVSFSFAQVTHDYTPFLRWGVGARPMGMGKAFSFIADDPNAIYYNPAGLGFLAGIQIESQIGQQFYRVPNNYFGFTKDGWGIGYLTYGSYVIPYWEINGSYKEFEIKGDCTLATIAYSKQISPAFSWGGSLKSFAIDGKKGYVGGESLDLGLLVRPSKYWQFGLSAQDLLSNISSFKAYKTDPLIGPQSKTDVLIYPNFKFGLANRNDWCTLAVELNNLGYAEELNFGLEKWLLFLFDSQLALRAGAYGRIGSYFNNAKQITQSAGLSFEKKWIQFSWALEFYPDEGTSSRSDFIISLDSVLLPAFLQGKKTSSKENAVGTVYPRSPGTFMRIDHSDQEQNGALVINALYAPLPRSDGHGASTAVATIVKLPPPATIATMEMPCKGNQPAFMTRSPSATTYTPLPGEIYRNIPISRTGEPSQPIDFMKYLQPGVIPPKVPSNRITDLPAGRYLVKLEANGSVPWYNTVELIAHQDTVVTATIEPAYGGLRGTAKESQWTPLQGGSVLAVGLGVSRRANISSNGQFSFDNLPMGSYLLKIEHPANPAFLTCEVYADAPSGYRTRDLGGVILQSYVPYGVVVGNIGPVAALSGYRSGSLIPARLQIIASPGIEASLNPQTGDYNFHYLEKGFHWLDIRPMGGWIQPAPRLVNVPDMFQTAEVETITLQRDEGYLPELRVHGLTLQKGGEGHWGNFNGLPGVTQQGAYRLKVSIENNGPAACGNFYCKVIHRITPTSTRVTEEAVLDEFLIDEGFAAGQIRRNLTLDWGSQRIEWRNDAINEIVVRLDSRDNVVELSENNNEGVLTYKLGVIDRDAKFFRPPQLYNGNDHDIAPGDTLKFKAWAEGVATGDNLIVRMRGSQGGYREIERTQISNGNLEMDLSFKQPGKWWLSFEISAEGDTNNANNFYVTGPFYVLPGEGDITYYESVSQGAPAYTDQAITVEVNVRNLESFEATGNFIECKYELQTADNINIQFLNENFPTIPAGGGVRQVAIPPGVLAPGDNQLIISFINPNLPPESCVIKRIVKVINSRINPIYTEDNAMEGKRIVLGVDSKISYYNLSNLSERQGEYYDWRYCDEAGHPFGLGLGAKANTGWEGQRSQINGYISKTFYVQSGEGIIYNSRFNETVRKRKKDKTTILYNVSYAGIIDSAIFQPILLAGLDYYLAKIDAGLALGDRSGAAAENYLVAPEYYKTILLCERGFPVKELTSSVITIVTLGLGGGSSSVMYNSLAGVVEKEVARRAIAEYLRIAWGQVADWLTDFDTWSALLDVQEKLSGSDLIIYNDVPLRENNYYTLFVKSEIQARCVGIAWAVTDFYGCYTKSGQEETFRHLQRGIWVTGGAVHFE